ncbi:MAG: hypothetical protein ACXWE3_03120 [Methylobacter sp.]
MSIPIGLVSGLYTGLIVTRYSRFAELRNEALRIIRSIDFMETEDKVRVSNNENVPNLLNISSDLLFLKHRKAGEQVIQLLKEVSSTTHEAQVGKLNVIEYGRCHAEWQRIARELPGNKIVLWSLWGKI